MNIRQRLFMIMSTTPLRPYCSIKKGIRGQWSNDEVKQQMSTPLLPLYRAAEAWLEGCARYHSVNISRPAVIPTVIENFGRPLIFAVNPRSDFEVVRDGAASRTHAGGSLTSACILFLLRFWHAS